MNRKIDSFERMREKESRVSLEDIREFLSYNPKTGVMVWLKVTSNRVLPGAQAGSITYKNKSRKKYMLIGFKGLNLQFHRVAWFLHFGEWPENQIDHEDGNGLNNRISNLRDVTRAEQQQNVKTRSDNTSGFGGVMFSKQKQKWISVIVVNGERIHLGVFMELADAIKARKKANKKYGFHANHGAKE